MSPPEERRGRTESRTALEQPLKQTANRAPKSVYAAAELELGANQSVELMIDGATNSQIWVGTEQVNPELSASGRASVRIELSAGTHRITIKIPADKLPETLRVQASNGQFSIN